MTHRGNLDSVLQALNDFTVETEEVTEGLKKIEKYSNHLRIAGELMRDSLIVLDNRGQIELVNPAFLKMFGFEKKDVIGKTPLFLDITTETNDKLTLQDIFSTKSNDLILHEEVTCKRKDDSYLTVDLACNIFERSSSFGFIIIIRDVSKRIIKMEGLKKEKNDLSSKNKILTIVFSLTEKFMDPYISTEDKINLSLEIFSKTLNAERVAFYINENETQEGTSYLAYEYVIKDGPIAPQINSFNTQKISWYKTLPNFFANMKENKHYIKHIDDLPSPEKDYAISNVKTMALFPIFHGGIWYGTIAFNHSNEIDYSQYEIEGLVIAVTILGQTIMQDKLLNKIYHHRKDIKYREDRYDRIVDSITDGMWTVNSKDGGIIVFTNSRGADKFGYTVEEMLGRSVLEFIFFKDQEDFRQAVISGEKTSLKVNIIHKNNRKEEITIIIADKLKRDDGSYDTIIILDFYNSENNIVIEEDKIGKIFRDIFEKSNEPKIVTDSRLNIIHSNIAFQKTFVENLNGKKMSSLFPKEQWNNYLNNCLKKMITNSIPIIMQNSTGKSIGVNINFTPIRDTDNKINYLIFTLLKIH